MMTGRIMHNAIVQLLLILLCRAVRTKYLIFGDIKQGDMIVNGGILTSLPSAKARVYILTREQARDAAYLSSIGFDVSEVV
jgi:hypothetical protein